MKYLFRLPVFFFLLFYGLSVRGTPLPLTNTEKFVYFGDDRLRVCFDARTGWPTEMCVEGQTVLTVDSARPLFFDIKEGETWISSRKGPRTAGGLVRLDDTTVRSRITDGSWQLDAYLRILPERRMIRRWFTLNWMHDKPGKLKGFWVDAGKFLCSNGQGSYMLPMHWPPVNNKVTNFRDGVTEYVWSSPCPVIGDNGCGRCAVWTIDELVPYADGGTCEVRQRKDGFGVVVNFKSLGHVRRNQPQTIGDVWLSFPSGDAEAALRTLPDWFRLVGQVPPPDRPNWIKCVTLYSLHPGGTIGSDCRDWGGFSAAADYLPAVRALGCNAVWLMPLEDKSIYWPRDYYKLQDGIGTPNDYKAFTKTARAHGLRVWQDCVPHGGSDSNARAKAHPEWLAYKEDGTTLNYWCFDFNWPEWIDYMSRVVAFYTKEYDLDGFRIDAVCGSHIPNWNEKIPYGRASFAQSQGGLAMQRALRKAVKAVRPDGANLAEAGDSIHGVTSDATYDFQLCYNVLHSLYKMPAETFVTNLRRWLSEQFFAQVPDLVRMRHLESHDALRSALWYGSAAERAAFALISWIPGIPLVYQEMEDGHFDAFREILHVRAAAPEIAFGTPDYRSPDAPPGVFSCLCAGTDAVSVPVINFTGRAVNSALTLPAHLPQNGTVYDLISGRAVTVHNGRLPFALGPFGYTVFRFGPALPVPPPIAEYPAAADIRLSAVLRRRNGTPVTAPYRLDITTNGTSVTCRVADFAGEDPAGVELVLALSGARRWFAHTAEGSFESPFRVRHPHFNGVVGPIYRRPQGNNILWDSRLHPFGFSPEHAAVGGTAGTNAVVFTPHIGTDVRLLDRIGKETGLHIAFTADKPERLSAVWTSTAACRVLPPRAAETGDPRLKVVAGGWQYEDGNLRVRIQRNGALRGIWHRKADGTEQNLLRDAAVYTDVGYGDKRYDQFSDVETGSLLTRTPDGTIELAFDGVLRNKYRFAKMRHPVAFHTVYRFRGDTSFTFAQSVRPTAAPANGKGFLAFMPAFPEIDSLRITDTKGLTRTEKRPAKGRFLSTHPAAGDRPVKELEVVTRSGGKLTFSDISYHGALPENVFAAGNNVFFAWTDGSAFTLKPNETAGFSAAVTVR